MVSAALFAQAAPAATPAAPATPPAPAKSAKADPGKVCKLETLLGSRLRKIVCYNAAQMAERTYYDKQNLEKIQAATPGPFSN